MNVFELRNQLVNDYSSYISSFIQIRDPRIRQYVDEQLQSGLLWPEALLQINPAFDLDQFYVSSISVLLRQDR